MEGNLDRFLGKVYQYYRERGYVCIFLSRLFNLLTLLFLVIFCTFIVGCIDHEKITKERNLSEVIISDCPRLSLFYWANLVVFSGFWLWKLYEFWQEARSFLAIRHFYHRTLNLDDETLQDIPWNSVIKKILDMFSTRESVLQNFTAHEIVNRLMRQENYLIALISQDVLNLNIPYPFNLLFGSRKLFTKVIEWNLTLCLIRVLFDPMTNLLRREVLDENFKTQLVSRLRRRFFFAGLLNVILAPFTLCFLIVYFLFRYGQAFHKNPSLITSKSYSPYARWILRDFNELIHTFDNRLNSSQTYAYQYTAFFKNYQITVIAKFIAFVFGSIALALTALSILDDDILLNFYITPGKSVLWYLGVSGIIWSVSHSMVPEPATCNEPVESLFKSISEQLRFLPYYLKNLKVSDCYSRYAVNEFGKLFDYRVVLFSYELLSIVVAPFMLWISFTKNVPQILDFCREFSMDVENIGIVCTFSVFDFRQHNHSPPNLLIQDRKMEQSFIAFKNTYPDFDRRNVPIREYNEDERQHLQDGSTADFIKKVIEEERLRTAQNGYPITSNELNSDDSADEFQHEIDDSHSLIK